MKCDRVKELLLDYLNGDLSAPEKLLVDEHIGICPSCREELRKLEKMRHLLSSLKPIEPPPYFTQKVIANYYARKERKTHPLRVFFFGGLKPSRAFAYAGFAIFLIFAFAFLSLLPWWGKARQAVVPSIPTLKRAPSIISAKGIGKILVLPQTTTPDAQGRIRIEIMVYPPSPQEKVWLSLLLSQGMVFASENPLLPHQKDYYIGKLSNPVSFWTDVQVSSQGVQWIRVSCQSGNYKWAEGLLFLPIGIKPSPFVSLSQSDIDSISLLALLCERTGKPLALSVPLSSKLNFSYQGDAEGAIHHYASLLGVTALKYNGGFIIEVP